MSVSRNRGGKFNLHPPLHSPFTPGIPSLWEVQDEFYRAAEKVLRGTEPASVALRLAQQQAEAVLERDRNRQALAQGNR